MYFADIENPFGTSVTIAPTAPVSDVLALLGKRAHRMAVVVDDENGGGIGHGAILPCSSRGDFGYELRS